jgi:hypothetical protein
LIERERRNLQRRNHRAEEEESVIMIRGRNPVVVAEANEGVINSLGGERVHVALGTAEKDGEDDLMVVVTDAETKPLHHRKRHQHKRQFQRKKMPL